MLLAAERLQHAQLRRGQRRAERGDGVRDALLRQHQRVHVALDEHGARLAADRVARLGDAVQSLALAEQRRLRRVEILRLVVAERAAAEGDGAAAAVADREHHAAAEAIVDAPVVAAAEQAGLQRDLARHLLRARAQPTSAVPVAGAKPSP